VIKLRDYQEKLVSDIRESFRQGYRRTLAVLPTGGGKTLCFSYIAAGVARNEKRVLIIAHRRELLKQISKALKQQGVRHVVMVGGRRGVPQAKVVVASVFTLATRVARFPAPDLIIGDEAHHFTPQSTWGKVAAAFPRSMVLGVTATPERADGKGLGLMFDNMVTGPSVAELTSMGFLSPVEVYAPPSPDLTGIHTRAGDYVKGELEQLMGKAKVTGDAVQHYASICPHKKAVVFCVSVKHAEDVALAFNSAGFRASSIDGGMDMEKRDRILSDFESGKLEVLTSCDLISEGFDLPAVEVAVMLRPTKSLGLYLQQAGRAIRISPGKTGTIILDHANNTRVHGFIDDERNWELTDDVARKKKGDGEKVETVRTCPQCFAAHRPSPVCPKCGHQYKVNGRKLEVVDGKLEILERDGQSSGSVKKVDWQRQYYMLLQQGRKRGMRAPEQWAFNVICNQEAKRLAGKRDVFGKPMINGLTAEERSRVKEAIGI